MLVTSASAVLMPALLDFSMITLDYSQNLRDFPLRDTVILRQFDARLKPDLQLAFWRLDMNVHAIFFTRVEVEPVASVPKHGWTHD
jgi:hypothetical protein